MSVHDPNLALDNLAKSLAKALPHRHVRRSLVMAAADLPDAEMTAGVVCVVCEGGGDFANYMGREGQLGHLQVSLVGFLRVDERDQPAEVERAELELLRELLAWTADPGEIRAGDSVLPLDFMQSRQLEHPYGWVVLKLDVRP